MRNIRNESERGEGFAKRFRQLLFVRNDSSLPLNNTQEEFPENSTISLCFFAPIFMFFVLLAIVPPSTTAFCGFVLPNFLFFNFIFVIKLI